jgi:ankyrin repeat protein
MPTCSQWIKVKGSTLFVRILIECYRRKLTHEHDRLALCAVLEAAEEYSLDIDMDDEFQFPWNPLRIRLPLGNLTFKHFDMLMHSLDTDLVRDRGDGGKLPIHIACRSKALVEVLARIAEQDAATLHTADDAGNLPLHECCFGAVDSLSVRFLVENGGVGTLAARNRDGALPLHLLCGSTNPSLRTVKYMIQAYPGSLAAQMNRGQYPFMIAACESSTASLSVEYELVRTNPDLVPPHWILL